MTTAIITTTNATTISSSDDETEFAADDAVGWVEVVTIGVGVDVGAVVAVDVEVLTSGADWTSNA